MNKVLMFSKRPDRSNAVNTAVAMGHRRNCIVIALVKTLKTIARSRRAYVI